MDEAVEISRPVHPLPDELEKMSEEETVCSFCGISYLIHREVARLKDELDRTKQKMLDMEDDIRNVQSLKKEIVLLKNIVKDCEDIKPTYEKLVIREAQLRQEHTEFQKSTERTNILQIEKNEKLETFMKNFIQCSRHELDIVRKASKDISKQYQVWSSQFSQNLLQIHKDKIQDQKKTLLSSFSEVELMTNSKFEKMESNLKSKIELLKRDLQCELDQKTTLQKLADEAEAKINEQADLNAKQISVIEIMKSDLAKLETDIMLKSDFNKQLNDQLAKAKIERSTAEQSLQKVENDFYNFRNKEEQANAEQKLKISNLEMELKTLQQTLFEKEELLRTSVAMEDMELMKKENSVISARVKDLENSLAAMTSKTVDQENRNLENENNYHRNLKEMEINFKREIAKYQRQIAELEKNKNIDVVSELENEIEIEKEKARAAIEMARLEIKAAEDNFRKKLEAKENEIQKSRSLAQLNEDEQDRNLGNIRAKNVELGQANTELQGRIHSLNAELSMINQDNEEKINSIENLNKSLQKQMIDKNDEIFKLSETIRKQIEERIELQSTIQNIKDKNENEVILLPIASRIKAASLPPIDHSKHPVKSAWASPTTTVIDEDPRKSSSAPVVKQSHPRKKNNLSSIRKRLNMALNRS